MVGNLDDVLLQQPTTPSEAMKYELTALLVEVGARLFSFPLKVSYSSYSMYITVDEMTRW